jgi:uncharacterized protein YceH (UPF0502 family)
MGITAELTPEQVRVIGCLLEKAVTTPDQYPLTLNALMLACNQKSSREPVMSLDQGTIERTARQLAEQHLISATEGKNGVSKYAQRLCNTLLSELEFSSAEYAVLCLLLLRGPQTPGELRARSGRLHTFDDNEEVKAVLHTLSDRDSGAAVARLPRRAGRQDHEYAHLFGGEIDSVAEEVGVVGQSFSVTHKEDKHARMEARLERLEGALVALATRLGESVDLGEAPQHRATLIGEGDDEYDLQAENRD